MKLKEMKSNVLRLLEEYVPDDDNLTSDEDIKNKINPVINQVMFDLCKYKKISAMATIDVNDDETIDLYNHNKLERFNQLNKITGVSFSIEEQFVTFNEQGTAKIFYYKNPIIITPETDDDYEFELKDDVLAIMPYGVAADLLKSDESNNYGNIYANKYKELLQLLDPRINTGIYMIEGGIDV